MIKSFEDALATSKREGYWQQFFIENPFALHMAMGYPVTIVQGQASVGGMKVDGSGGKISDFLAKNPLTDNVALVEIKKPQTKLLRKAPFRDEVYGPSSDLAASIVQVLDQRYRLQKQIATIRDNDRSLSIETFDVRACLIIGSTPEGLAQKKSFEMFRGNSVDVAIVTYDEVLGKLRELRELLNRADPEAK
jgi:hypothetical protein